MDDSQSSGQKSGALIWVLLIVLHRNDKVEGLEVNVITKYAKCFKNAEGKSLREISLRKQSKYKKHIRLAKILEQKLELQRPVSRILGSEKGDEILKKNHPIDWTKVEG